MAVQLSVGKPKLGTSYGKNSFYAPVVPKPKAPVAPKKVPLPAGMAPINTGMSDADREAGLMGGGAWGTYSPATVQALDTGWGGVQQGISQTVKAQKPGFKQYVEAGIPGDWEVQGAETAMGDQLASLRSAFGLEINDALVNLGLPEDAKVKDEFGSYITPEAIQKAIANKYSTAAQIAQQEAVGRANAEAALAARGSLRSGATTNRFTGIAAEGEKGRYQAVQDFLSGARGGLRGIADAKTRLEQGVVAARQNASQRLATAYGYEYPDEEETTTTSAAATGGSTAKTPVTVAKPKPKAPPKKTALQIRSEALNKKYGLGK